MLTLDLSSEPRTFQLDPQSPQPRPSFLPRSSSPNSTPATTVDATAPVSRPATTSRYFDMPSRKSTSPAKTLNLSRKALAPVTTNSLIPAFLTVAKTTPPESLAGAASPGMAASTSAAQQQTPRQSMADNGFGGIEGVDEDFTPEEIQRSAERKRQRALKRARLSGISSEAGSSSTPPTSSAPTVPRSDDTRPIDLSGSSPAPRRSPRKHASSVAPPTSPSPADRLSPAKTRRRRILSSDDEDEVPLSISRKRPPKPVIASRGGSPPPSPPRSARKTGKGKARADPDDEDEASPEVEDVTENDASGSTRDSAFVDDEYDAGWHDMTLDDFSFDVDDPIPVDDIPDFRALPSTQPAEARTRTPSPIVIEDDDEEEVVPARVPNKGAAARKAALAGMSFGPVSSPSSIKFQDLTLLDAMDPALRAFYEDHWRRGADCSDNESDDDPDNFGVAAVVQKRGGPRARGRGGWGRGRGRGGARRVFRKKK